MTENITTSSQLIKALETPSPGTRHPIGEILLDLGVINEKQLTEALKIRNLPKNNEKIGSILNRLGYATSADIMKAVSLNLNIPCVSLSNLHTDPQITEYIPASFARAHNIVPIMKHKDRIVIAMEEPMDIDTLNMLNFLTGHLIEPVLATGADIELAISRFYGSADDEDVLKELPPENLRDEIAEYQAIKLAEDKPTVRLVQNLILDGINRKASDIHIRPKEKTVDIIFRIDGSLVPVRSIPKSVLPAVVSRIKIIGGMNITERRVPQDGRTKVRTHNRNIDLRISIMPSIHGESVVIRILDTSAGMKSISEIGFSDSDEANFRGLIQKSAGMLLVTGPTGSGKSTTLYAALQEIKKNNINIITVEDPVEYQVDDITQIQVNNVTGYTFARALKNILRHDPDAIMIGEIRDPETAKMAVESALTGHLVLSTLHTNSAAATITRLLEIGLPAYLLSTTILGILAQRLVKKNCTHCLAEEEINNTIRTSLGLSLEEVFYKGKGCDSCNHTGYSGRLAVYELLIIDEKVRKLIQPNVESIEIDNAAKANGMTNLTQQAIQLARKKQTSLAEVYRVRLE